MARNPQPFRSFDTRRSATAEAGWPLHVSQLPTSIREGSPGTGCAFFIPHVTAALPESIPPELTLGRAASSFAPLRPPRPASDRGRSASFVNLITNDLRHGCRRGSTAERRRECTSRTSRQRFQGSGRSRSALVVSSGGTSGLSIVVGGRAAAGGAAGDRRRRAGLPERGRPRPRRAAAQAVRQARMAGSGRDGRNRNNGNRRRGRTRRGRRHEQHKTKEDTMTTQATTIGGTGTRPRASLEELVDRLMAALFRAEPEDGDADGNPQRSPAASTRRGGSDRRGDLDGALAVFAGVDAAKTETQGGADGPTPSGRTW